MEEREEMLLRRLEAEGQQIAMYRQSLLELTKPGIKINCPKLVAICKHLNNHISMFDTINDELSRLEAIGIQA
ncbi:MAG: hypothetical protein K6G76_06030 [Lachnospiraceae bacterium]|nr:hypothetical protein [Lachnospiraceae bacterium]